MLILHSISTHSVVSIWPVTNHAPLGNKDTPLLLAKQTHSTTVLDLDKSKDLNSAKKSTKNSSAPWDGAVWSDETLCVGIRTADCMPVVLHDVKSRRSGVCHLSWINARKGMLAQFLAKFFGLPSTSPHHTHVWVGPHLCGHHLWLSSNIIKEWHRDSKGKIAPYVIQLNEFRYAFNWEHWLTDELKNYGITHLTFYPACTLTTPIFPSYRRTGTARPSILTRLGPAKALEKLKSTYPIFNTHTLRSPAHMRCSIVIRY